MAQKASKSPKFNKKNLIHVVRPPTPGLIHILEINNIHNEDFFLSTCDNPPFQRLSTFEDLPPPYLQYVDNLPFFLTPHLAGEGLSPTKLSGLVQCIDAYIHLPFFKNTK